MRECSSRSCHMRLQWTQPLGTRVLQLEKWRTKDSSPLQAGKLQGTWLPLSILSLGPIVLHPSLHMWRRASIASYSCKYTFLSSIFLNLSCFLWKEVKLRFHYVKLNQGKDLQLVPDNVTLNHILKIITLDMNIDLRKRKWRNKGPEVNSNSKTNQLLQ